MSSIESMKSKPIFSPSRMRTRPNEENNLVEHDLSSSATSEEGQTLLSETVTSLASTVYNELERIIKNFGEDSVKDLMPVMISTLESLNNALHEREVSKLEIDALKEQNEQLFQQYEREKAFHKEYQQVRKFDFHCFIEIFLCRSDFYKPKIISKKLNVKMKKNYKVSNQL